MIFFFPRKNKKKKILLKSINSEEETVVDKWKSSFWDNFSSWYFCGVELEILEKFKSKRDYF